MGQFQFGPFGTWGPKSGPGDAADPPYSIGSDSSWGQGGSQSQNTGSSFGMQFPDSVWGAQVPFFENLYSQANQMMMGGGNQGQAQGLFEQGLQGFNQMMNPGVNPHLEAYAGDVQQNFTDNILPGIRRDAGGRGMVGGTRQGVAEGVAGGYANRDITNMASKLYGEDMNRMLGAMGMMPQYGAFGMSIPWFGMNQMAGIMGSPTVLGGGGIQGSQTQG
ncbi:unnamed protein product, partial [marine sediment metagenome]